MNERAGEKSQALTLRSPLAWALLGLVIEHPSYGYELARRFQSVYGEWLTLSNTRHIYRLLETLSSHGLIEALESHATEQPDTRTPQLAGSGQPKPHYRATAHGVCAYEEWLLTQLLEDRRRSGLFARQLAMLEPEEAIAVIEEYERKSLTKATQAPASKQAADESAECVAERLADEGDRLALGAKLSWLEYARRELEAELARRGERR
jgi:DNA-binding PadR family transcriptional regulator